MDAFSSPEVEEVVIMSSSQVAKTTILENITGYFIDQDPAPILIIQPTLEMAGVFSTDRLDPMLRDTPCLRGRVKSVNTRDSKNTKLHKVFPGGFVALAGANSPASLASRPVRVVLQDEVDRYPQSAGVEGDPASLADKRAQTFWNRKKGKTSTPTIKGLSRIEKAYKESDMRKYFVPCPKCGEFQVLVWSQVKWPKEGDGEKKKHIYKKAFYECAACGAHLSDADKLWMIRRGEWRAEKEFAGTAGFSLWEGYSPWSSWAEIVSNFLKAKRGGAEMLKTWVNTCLGETWAEKVDTVEDKPLYNRREEYGPEVPERACVLTAGVDVQADRLEVQVIAWGPGGESWPMDYRIFRGDTEQKQVWEDLDEYLLIPWIHEGGSKLEIKRVFVDSGFKTERVYKWVKKRMARGVFAVKGSNSSGDPLVSRPSRKNVAKIPVFFIGTDTAKDTIYSRLALEEPGAGYIHFRKSKEFDEEYFRQLTSETVRIQYEKGQPKRVWKPKFEGIRNEVLDTFVYSLAALEFLNPNMQAIAEKLQKKRRVAERGGPPDEIREEKKEETAEDTGHKEILKIRRGAKPRRGGFVNRGWR
jgi:phage terminase large subunit GpA-like protein